MYMFYSEVSNNSTPPDKCNSVRFIKIQKKKSVDSPDHKDRRCQKKSSRNAQSAPLERRKIVLRESLPGRNLYSQRNLFEILLNQTEIRLHLPIYY